MHPCPDDELLSGAVALARRRRIALQRARCLKAAKLSFVGAAGGILFLCLAGMRPAGVAVPVLLAVLSLLFAAASAALFAHVARLYLETPGQDADDEGDGPGGGGSDEPPEPPGGGSLGFDWEQFEQDFRVYCERVAAAR